MSVYEFDDFEEPSKGECDSCGAILEKWISCVPGGDFCVNCAQAMMRRLFEDLIEYHNGRNVSHISLLNILYHGDVHRSNVLNLPLVPVGNPFKQPAKTEQIEMQSKPIGIEELKKENQKLRNTLEDMRDDINRLNSIYRMRQIKEERKVKEGIIK